MGLLEVSSLKLKGILSLQTQHMVAVMKVYALLRRQRLWAGRCGDLGVAVGVAVRAAREGVGGALVARQGRAKLAGHPRRPCERADPMLSMAGR